MDSIAIYWYAFYILPISILVSLYHRILIYIIITQPKTAQSKKLLFFCVTNYRFNIFSYYFKITIHKNKKPCNRLMYVIKLLYILHVVYRSYIYIYIYIISLIKISWTKVKHALYNVFATGSSFPNYKLPFTSTLQWLKAHLQNSSTLTSLVTILDCNWNSCI